MVILSSLNDPFLFIYQNLRRSIFLNLFLYRLLNGSEIWHPNQCELQKLELFQSRVLKWITSGSSYEDRLRKLNRLPICLMQEFEDLCLFDKIICGYLDFSIWEKITVRQQPRYPLRHLAEHQFVLQKTAKKSTDTSFLRRTTAYANKLHRNTDLTLFLKPSVFKTRLYMMLKCFLANKYNHNCKSYFN